MFSGLLACARESGDAPRCSLSRAEVVAEAEAPRFDALALIEERGGAALAWSDESGLYLRHLDGKGVARSKVVRVGERCPGGVALLHDTVGCVRPGDDDASEVTLFTLQGDAVTQTRPLGYAGRDGRGIALARQGERTFALYHDGRTGVYEVHLARITSGAVDDRSLSRVGKAASQPSLSMVGDDLIALWAETDFDLPGKAPTVIALSQNGEPARTVLPVGVDYPAPRLTRDQDGLVLTFRDKPPKERKAELYAVRLDTRFVPVGTPRKLGRANSGGGPSLHACGARRFALTPREYGGERYIAVHAVSARFENLTGGHQFYESNHDFVAAEGVCMGDNLLVVAGEQRTPADRGVSLAAMTFACE